MFDVDINSRNFIYFKACLFLTTLSVILHDVELFRNVPFDPLMRLLWGQNRVSHQYHQSISINLLTRLQVNFTALDEVGNVRFLVRSFYALGASASNLRGRGQESIKNCFL